MAIEKANYVTPGWEQVDRIPLPMPQEKKREQPVMWNWAKGWWLRKYNKRRKERIQQDARESKSGVHIFLSMARFAINMAVETEPNKDVRRTKRRTLQDRWRDYQRDLLNITRS